MFEFSGSNLLKGNTKVFELANVRVNGQSSYWAEVRWETCRQNKGIKHSSCPVLQFILHGVHVKNVFTVLIVPCTACTEVSLAGY